MQLSYDALNILLFLCPGLLITVVIRLLVYRKESGMFETIVSALLWSLLVYAALTAIGRDAAVQLTETKRGDTTYRGIVFNPSAIGWMLCLAALVAALTAFALNRDWFGKFLRWTGISSQSGRATIWLDVFAEYRKFVVVHLSDERRVFGWVLHYSNSGDDGYIYLHEPRWIDAENRWIDTGSHGIFFVKRDLIDFIEFLNSPTKQLPIDHQTAPVHAKAEPTSSHS